MMGVYLIFQIFFSHRDQDQQLFPFCKNGAYGSVFLAGKRQGPEGGTACRGWLTVPSAELF